MPYPMKKVIPRGGKPVDKSFKKPRMTQQQKRLVKAVVVNPTGTLEDLGEQAGYKGRSQTWRALKAPAVVDALDKVRGLMEQREKLSLGALLGKLEEGLEATEIKSLKVDGTDFTVESEVKDFKTRHKYLETALELHGARENKSDLTPSGPINVAIILGGGGTEAEKSAVADVLVAARIARGLHPLENRKMTADEAEEYRRTQ